MDSEDSKYIDNNIDLLFDDLYHPNPNINNQATLSLIKYFPIESIDRLICNLEAKDLNIRRKSVNAISLFGSKAVSKLFELFFSGLTIEIKITCLKAFVLIASRNSEDILIKDLDKVIQYCMSAQDPVIILTFVSLLRQLGDKGLPYLIILSQDNNILKAKAAITALGEIKNKKAEICLSEISRDMSKDQIIIEGALEALKIISHRM